MPHRGVESRRGDGEEPHGERSAAPPRWAQYGSAQGTAPTLREQTPATRGSKSGSQTERSTDGPIPRPPTSVWKRRERSTSRRPCVAATATTTPAPEARTTSEATRTFVRLARTPGSPPQF